MNRLILSAAAFVAAASLAGCGAEADTDTGAALREMRQELASVTKTNEKLMGRLERLEDRLEAHGDDLAALGRRSAEAAAMEQPEVAGDPAAEGAAAPSEEAAAVSNELAALLSSDEGRTAVEKAMQSIEDRRSEQRRDRMVGMMLGRFAEQADLTPEQSEKMRGIVSDSFKRIGEVWSSMRDAGSLTAEERTVLREENMAKMEEIRDTSSEEVKAILNSEQYLLYEEQASRMRGGFGGRGGARGGDGGGGGGFRGR